MPEPFTDDAEDVSKAIDALYGAFSWSESEEGFDFWSNIDDRLERIKQSYLAGKTENL